MRSVVGWGVGTLGFWKRYQNVFQGETIGITLWDAFHSVFVVMTATTDIVQKLWGLCNVLRDDGVTYFQYLTELTYLLFWKMMQEREQEHVLPQE